MVTLCGMSAGPILHWLPFVECLQDLHYTGYGVWNTGMTYTTLVMVCGMPAGPTLHQLCFVEYWQDLHYTGYGLWNAGRTYTKLVRIYACRTYTTLVTVCRMPAGPTLQWLQFVECLECLKCLECAASGVCSSIPQTITRYVYHFTDYPLTVTFKKGLTLKICTCCVSSH